MIPKEKEIIVKENSILKIKLDKTIAERTSGNPLPQIDGLSFSNTDNIELKEIIDNIEKAKFDEKITGIYLNLSGMQAGLSNVEEIREKLLSLKNQESLFILILKYILNYHIIFLLYQILFFLILKEWLSLMV